MKQAGIADKIKGRIKEAAGALLGGDDVKREGRTDQTAGKVKEKAEEAVDEAREALTPERSSGSPR